MQKKKCLCRDLIIKSICCVFLYALLPISSVLGQEQDLFEGENLGPPRPHGGGGFVLAGGGVRGGRSGIAAAGWES